VNDASLIKAQCEGFVQTPPLWKGEVLGIKQFDFPTLTLDAFQASPIPGNIRFGHRIEHIFLQLMSYDPSYEVKLHNLPIRQEKQTLGEIDFILEDRLQERWFHVELTYKFYIIDPSDPRAIRRLIGPNRRDAFYEKVKKIKDHQFPLLHSKQGREVLQTYQIDSRNIEQECVFKGQLFYPYGEKEVSIGPLNRDCIVGYWLQWDTFSAQVFESAEYYMPSKYEWVLVPHRGVNWYSYATILKDVRQSLDLGRSPMLWLKNKEGNIQKLFVVFW
jgi:hypothetical protein